ncbi:hypothetical protein GMJAKD_09665 [Candidatus Electrothrix aarhusensis]
MLQQFSVAEQLNTLPVHLDQSFIAHVSKNSRQVFRSCAEQAGQLFLGHVKEHLVGSPLLFGKIDQMGGKTMRCSVKGKTSYFFNELTQSLRQPREHGQC